MKIVHVFRAPVGGLFRHVRDLCRGQSALGHEVGIICDSTSGGKTAETLLNATLPYCSLGIHRIAITRLPGLGDLFAARAVAAKARAAGASIIHGHGAKGGVYGRLAARIMGIPSVYTPHGGSLHYDWNMGAGSVFLGTEWAFAKLGHGVLFVCNYERDQFERKIGLSGIAHRVVHNGLWPEEFRANTISAEATDLVFIGDMRPIKGVDVLIEALALVSQRQPVTATLVGDGPSLEDFKALAGQRGLGERVKFPGRKGTAAALDSGRIMVLPSRSESFPYVVLEAAAAEKPIIASAVGGIAEVLPPANLVPSEQPLKLAARIAEALTSPGSTAAAAGKLRDHVAREFSAEKMVKSVTEFYFTLSQKLHHRHH